MAATPSARRPLYSPLSIAEGIRNGPVKKILSQIKIRKAFQTPKIDGDVSYQQLGALTNHQRQQVVAPETDDLEALTGCQCRRDLPTDGVAAEVEVLELREAPELRRYDAMEAVCSEVKLPEVSEVTQGGCNVTLEVEIWKMECDDTAATGTTHAAGDTAPLAHWDRQVSP
uniref:Uncharacterized protein n=1 Tax=Oryza glumipatula TaxID=40148 RepID=A0A0E0ASY7_9ORYZ